MIHLHALLLNPRRSLIGLPAAVLGLVVRSLLLPLLISGGRLPAKEAIPLPWVLLMCCAGQNIGPYLRRRQVARPALGVGVPALAGSWISGSLRQRPA